MRLQTSVLPGTLFSLAIASIAAPAAAQPPPPPPAAALPAMPAAAVQAQMPPQAKDPIAAALAPRPGGLTAEDAAKLAAKSKPSVRQKHEELKIAAARVDQALVGFFPRVSVSASYTRLSPIDQPSLGTSVGFQSPNPTDQPGLVTVGACPNVPGYNVPAGTQCLLNNGNPAFAAGLKFPVILNNYSFVGSVSVPISDYVLRLSQNYSAASANERAAKLSLEAETLQVAADAKVAYFNWVRAKGSVVVAAEAVEQARSHVEDAKKSFTVGLVSKADVLRLEAQLAAAQQSYAEAQAFGYVAEEQLRTVIGAPSDRVLEIGSDVMNENAAPPAEALQGLQDQAFSRRLEIRALDETIYSLKKIESLAKAGYAPRIDATANAYYSNPNQRIFPQQEKFTLTWDVGVRLSWTLNDTFTTIGAAAEAKARAASVAEQRNALRDGLRLEVASAYADVTKAPPTIEAADRGMVAAEESLRVRRELFRNGKATGSELVDAEAELTRARLRRLDAHVGLLVARARLDHATGRDAPARQPTE